MVTRRSVLKGIAVMPLGAVLADPELAAAAADSLQTVSITAASGVKVSAVGCHEVAHIALLHQPS